MKLRCGVAVVILFLLVGVQASAEPIRLVVDGLDIICDPPPNIDQGVTFVPLRVVADALGVYITYDKAQNAVLIGDPPDGLDLVNQLPPFKYREKLKIEPVTISGRTYNLGFWGSNYVPISWNLGGKYGRFSFTSGPDDSWDYQMGFLVIGDGEVIGRVPDLSRNEGIRQYTFDVTGVKILTVTVEVPLCDFVLINPRVQ